MTTEQFAQLDRASTDTLREIAREADRVMSDGARADAVRVFGARNWLTAVLVAAGWPADHAWDTAGDATGGDSRRSWR